MRGKKIEMSEGLRNLSKINDNRITCRNCKTIRINYILQILNSYRDQEESLIFWKMTPVTVIEGIITM